MNAGGVFIMTQAKAAAKHVKKGREGGELAALIAPILSGLSAGTIVLLALIALSAFLFSRIDLPLELMVPFATCSIGAAVFAAALTFTAIRGHGGLLFGAAMGAVLFLLIYAVSAAGRTAYFTQLTALKALLMILSGATGGFCGVGLRHKHQKKKKRIKT